MSRPLFITFEGGEGTGKTTNAKLLSSWMEKRNIQHILTKEPGSPHIKECEEIREILLNPKNNLTMSTELFLFLADRSQHVNKLIKPSIQSGKHVICDRYIFSTIAYQCARGIGRDKIDKFIEFAIDNTMPDITFVLDAPIDVGLDRAKSKSIYKDGDRIEREDTNFHNDVRYRFLKLAESLSDQHLIYVINAEPPKTIDQVHKEIVDIVSKKLWSNIVGEDYE